MKNINKIFAIAIVALGFSANNAIAQTTASASGNATIVAPITLTNNVPLEFGKVAVQALTAGSVTLTPAAATTPTPALGVTLLTGTTRTAAKFTVGGVASYIYTITVPASALTISDGASHNMTISDFSFASVNAPSLTGGTLTSGGADEFYVGGKLNVAAGQTPNSYTGSFNVTVNYN